MVDTATQVGIIHFPMADNSSSDDNKGLFSDVATQTSPVPFVDVLAPDPTVNSVAFDLVVTHCY